MLTDIRVYATVRETTHKENTIADDKFSLPIIGNVGNVHLMLGGMKSICRIPDKNISAPVFL